jgi:hypothetical protein
MCARYIILSFENLLDGPKKHHNFSVYIGGVQVLDALNVAIYKV